MSEAIIGSLIGAVATVIAAIFGSILKERGLPAWLGGRSRHSLVGTWNARWYGQKLRGEEPIHAEDRVEIKNISKDIFIAAGINSLGNYEVHGYFSARAHIVFWYRGNDRQNGLTGAGLLTLNALGDKAEGRWSGFSTGDKEISGRVVWTRAPDTR